MADLVTGNAFANNGSVGSNIRPEVVLTGLHRWHGRSQDLLTRCHWVEQRGCGWLWSGMTMQRHRGILFSVAQREWYRLAQFNLHVVLDG